MTGHYCEAGSSNGTSCPPGSYLNATGGRSVSDCISCTPGMYCNGYGNTWPTADCDAGELLLSVCPSVTGTTKTRGSSRIMRF